MARVYKKKFLEKQYKKQTILQKKKYKHKEMPTNIKTKRKFSFTCVNLFNCQLKICLII